MVLAQLTDLVADCGQRTMLDFDQSAAAHCVDAIAIKYDLGTGLPTCVELLELAMK
jgi:hypothetical protein